LEDLLLMGRSPLAIGVLVLFGAGAWSPLDVVPRAAGTAGTLASGPAASEARSQAPEDPQRAQFVKWFEAQPKVNVPIDADGAKVLIVKFNDYQCPPCRESYLGYKAIIEKYMASKQLKFVVKHFPLERECNAAVGSDLHLASCEAAAAVVMAQRKGTSDKLEEWFFANQGSLNPESVRRAASQVAGVTDFDAQYARALTLVKTDAGMGGLLGAKSTPTFVINGRLIAGMLPPPLFEAAIQHELGK
jgi:protein-disulfide isomerase